MSLDPTVPPVPASLRSSNPLRWVSVFGPGAIMASLTIGTGELIFSSRGGAIFGYRILFLFLLISAMKWGLVYSAARHMVLTGVHPLQRWCELPGPRGWLPAVMFVFAVLCFPIWLSFHSSVIGDLLGYLTGTKAWLGGAMVHVWGSLVLICIVALSLTKGYAALERVQLVIVTLMLGAMMVALALLKPDWPQMILGALWPQRLVYPEWLLHDASPLARKIAATPVWVEASLYVGVIGGASYDYLAYTSYLREKAWGLAGAERSSRPLTEATLNAARLWLRAPLVDCGLSFFVVVLFSAVFVASGWLVLAPQQQIPGDGSFLEYQAQFVTQLHPWLYPLYVVGTLLTMLGTLYGTLEIGPPTWNETWRLLSRDADSAREPSSESTAPSRLRRNSILWGGIGALVILAISFVHQLRTGTSRPPGLTTLLMPAGLFTGVLSCGFICLLNPWMDRVLPKKHRAPWALQGMNIVAGCMFLAIGMQAYWELGGVNAILTLGGTVAIGLLVATVVGMRNWK